MLKFAARPIRRGAGTSAPDALPLGNGRVGQMPGSFLKAMRIGVACAVIGLPFSASAEYLLDGGDVLEVSVLGKSDLTRRTTVDVDGNILVPLVGEVKAAGATLTELRAKVADLLSTSSAVRVSDIAVQLVEPRPFYIQGDVMRAGSYPYRPGATVRQALAIAGGLSVVQPGTVSPIAVAELRGRYKSLKSDLAKQQIRVAGLRAELQNKPESDLANTLKPTLSPSDAAESLLQAGVAELAQIEMNRLRTRYAERQKELQLLNTSLKLADSQVAALEQGQKQDEQAVQQQVAELERVADLARRGLASSSRVTDEQRAAVLLKSREMDTKSRLAAARQARVETQRRLESADERTLRVPQELQDAIAELERTQAQLEAVGEQLALSGVALEMLDGSDERLPPEIAIYRKQNGAYVRIDADADTEIKPSDVIEVFSKSGMRRTASTN